MINKSLKEIQITTKSFDLKDETSFDIIALNKKYFRVDIPTNLVGMERDHMLGLGPDYLMGNMFVDTIFNYVLSPFYWFLY